MTDHKHLKSRIRARMAKTGERYTTARRHIVGELAAPGRGNGSDLRYPAFGRGTEHTASLLTHVLHHAGVTSPITGTAFTEADVLGLAGGIGFLAALFEYQGHPPIVTLVTRSHPAPMAATLCSRLGLATDTHTTTSAAKAAVGLDAHLAAGRVALVTVGRGDLPHHACDGIEANEAYDVVVTAVEGDVVRLDDEAPQPTLVDRATLDRARAANRKAKHALVAILDPAIASPIEEAYRDAVDQTVANLTEPVLNHAFDANFGFRGMDKLAASLSDRRTKKGWPQILAAPEAHAFAMVRIYECLSHEYGGPGALRPLYAEFLRSASAVLDRPALVDAAEAFDLAGAAWLAAADAALPDSAAPGSTPALAALRDAMHASWDALLDASDDGSAVRRAKEATAAGRIAYADPSTTPGPEAQGDQLALIATQVRAAAAHERTAVEALTSP